MSSHTGSHNRYVYKSSFDITLDETLKALHKRRLQITKLLQSLEAEHRLGLSPVAENPQELSPAITVIAAEENPLSPSPAAESQAIPECQSTTDEQCIPADTACCNAALAAEL